VQGVLQGVRFIQQQTAEVELGNPLVVTKSGPGSAHIGDPVTYIVQVTNSSDLYSITNVSAIDDQTGLIALTKVDLVDEEMRALATEDVRDLVQGTFLEGRWIVLAVSCRCGRVPLPPHFPRTHVPVSVKNHSRREHCHRNALGAFGEIHHREASEALAPPSGDLPHQVGTPTRQGGKAERGAPGVPVQIHRRRAICMLWMICWLSGTPGAPSSADAASWDGLAIVAEQFPRTLPGACREAMAPASACSDFNPLRGLLQSNDRKDADSETGAER